MTWFNKNWSKLLTFIVILFVGMRLLDFLMLWSVFGSFASTFRNLGMTNDHLVNALSVAAMTVAALLAKHLLWKFVLRRTSEGTLIFGAAVTLWMVILYGLSLPKPGEYFNPSTGQPRNVYLILPNGEIDIKPLGYKYHPATGDEMLPLTKEAMKLYADKVKNFEKSRATASNASAGSKAAVTEVAKNQYPKFVSIPVTSWVRETRFHFGSLSYFYEKGCMSLDIPSVYVDQAELALLFEFTNHCDDNYKLMEPYNRAYLVTSSGVRLDLTGYTKGFYKGLLDKERWLVPEEKGQVWMHFQPLPAQLEPKQVKLTFEDFEQITIRLQA